MKSRPILFSATMVRALLAGNKTQTRRICKSQPYGNGIGFIDNEYLCHNDYLPPSAMLMDVTRRGRIEYTTSNLEGWEAECPYGQSGDQLWVRETFAHYYRDNSEPLSRGPEDVVYKADGLTPDEYVYGTWKPSIHMPRWASRITLEITGVRVERLQDISVADAIAEGCPGGENGDRYAALEQYRALWESINGLGSWDLNPWVWALNFRRVS